MFKIKTTQLLPIDINQAWDFFSDPKNLNTITPNSLKFKTLSGDDSKMYAGQIICYRISPFPAVNLEWVTEITHVKEKQFFVDEQRFGPYKFWHHKHFFRECQEGVEIIDIVHYKLPFGFIGRLFHPIVIKPKLNEIFEFRRKKLEELFN